MNGQGQAIIPTDWTEIHATVEIRNETMLGKLIEQIYLNSLGMVLNCIKWFIYCVFSCFVELTNTTMPSYISNVQIRSSNQMQAVINYLKALDESAQLSKLKTTSMNFKSVLSTIQFANYYHIQ